MFRVALVQTDHDLLAPLFGLWKVGDDSRRKYDTSLEMPDARKISNAVTHRHVCATLPVRLLVKSRKQLNNCRHLALIKDADREYRFAEAALYVARKPFVRKDPRDLAQ